MSEGRGLSTAEVAKQLREIADTWATFCSAKSPSETVPVHVAVIRTVSSRLNRAAMEIGVLATDTQRLDWMERAYNRETSDVAPYFTVGKKGAVVWNQMDGLTMMGQGPTLREAIDAAMRASLIDSSVSPPQQTET